MVFKGAYMVNSSAVTGLFDTAAGLIPLRCMGVVPPERPAPRCGLEMKPFPLSLLVPLLSFVWIVMSSGEGQPAADIHTEPSGSEWESKDRKETISIKTTKE